MRAYLLTLLTVVAALAVIAGCGSAQQESKSTDADYQLVSLYLSPNPVPLKTWKAEIGSAYPSAGAIRFREWHTDRWVYVGGTVVVEEVRLAKETAR